MAESLANDVKDILADLQRNVDRIEIYYAKEGGSRHIAFYQQQQATDDVFAATHRALLSVVSSSEKPGHIKSTVGEVNVTPADAHMKYAYPYSGTLNQADIRFHVKALTSGQKDAIAIEAKDELAKLRNEAVRKAAQDERSWADRAGDAPVVSETLYSPGRWGR